MKRTIVAIACAIGCFCVGNAHNVNSLLPQKREKKEVKVGDSETKFVHELMQKNDAYREDRTIVSICRRNAFDRSSEWSSF